MLSYFSCNSIKTDMYTTLSFADYNGGLLNTFFYIFAWLYGRLWLWKPNIQDA